MTDGLFHQRPEPQIRQCTHRALSGAQCYNRALVSVLKNPHSHIDTTPEALCSQCLEVFINRLGPNDEVVLMRI